MRGTLTLTQTLTLTLTLTLSLALTLTLTLTVGKLELGQGHELVVEVMRGARRLMGGVNSGKFALGRNHLPISLAPP